MNASFIKPVIAYSMHRKLGPAGLLRLVNDFANISQPFLVKALVNFIVNSQSNTSNPPPISIGFVLVDLH